MSDDALPLCACVQYYDSHHPECPARRANEALASRLDSAENAMREVVSHLQNSQRGSTHWAGCPDVHPVCKAIDMLVDALPLRDVERHVTNEETQ